jgi:hypothetical protein
MNKLILSLILCIPLSGCMLVDAYLMTKYDPNEYKIITDIRAESQRFKNQCDNVIISKSNAQQLSEDTQLFSLYSEHIPRNKDMITASKDLQMIAQGLSDQYAKTDKVSPVFCKIKFDSVEKSAEKIQKVIGSKPR